MNHILFFLHPFEHLTISTNQSLWCMAPLPKKKKPKDAAIERVSILLKDLLLAQEEQEVVEKDSGGEVRSHRYRLSIEIGNWLSWIMQLRVLANLNQFLEGQRRYRKHLTLKCISQLSAAMTKVPEIKGLKEKRFSVIHSFKGCDLWWFGHIALGPVSRQYIRARNAR